jgi:hypothetical protein
VALFAKRWTWERLQKHMEACVSRALDLDEVQGVLRRRGLSENDLRGFYMRMSDAGTSPDQREAAITNPTLLERYCQTVREAKGRLSPDALAMFARWVRTDPLATVPQ